MRDYRKFFRQLCLAMGIVTTAPACSSPEANQPVDVVSAVDSQTTDSGASVDGVGSMDVESMDVTANDVGSAEDVTSVDVVPSEDAVAEDVVGPKDAAPLGDAGTPPTDSSGPDIVAVDVSGPDDVAHPDITVVDIGAGEDTSAPIACEGGQPGLETCYTAEELTYIIENPPFGGKPGQKPNEEPLPPEGCPSPEVVLDGCCNPAQGPGELVDETCCYVHCQGSCCGRPFVVEGVARVAELADDSSWSGSPEAAIAMPAPAAKALASAWRADAQDEHASVASFMRFGMELLHLGAPPDMVADAALAAADEVRHAQIACSIASRFDGLRRGPAALPCADVSARTDWAEIAAACVHEGCVGETLAASQLSSAARAIRGIDAALAGQVQGIADDEARHAELAWRFVAWSFREGDKDVRDAIRNAFRSAAESPVAGDAREALLAGVSDADRRLGGRLGARAASRVNRETLTEVILPCAEALFDSVA